MRPNVRYIRFAHIKLGQPKRSYYRVFVAKFWYVVKRLAAQRIVASVVS
jgi:hypothetical protein